ncbi:MAG: hypothetical protein CEE43_01415 [Promethearchaeota archaeon Loki_b32]|nr:MAG: hypothetical protein CEE43_01415 [Candidatus Lokiarchaeota archaeon Loki_b32]
MIETDDLAVKGDYHDILVVCPTCKAKKELKIPIKIINQAKQLTTVSIPAGAVCEHSFQTFVDKNFIVRGYQIVDFEFSHMEFYESSDTELGETDDPTSKLSSQQLFQDIISLLRGYVDDKEILGSGMFTVDGHVLYSSLPSNTLFSIIKEFEVRSEKKLSSLKKMYLELENDQKICSNYIEIQEMRFALVLFFSQTVKLGMGNLYLNDLVKKIRKLEN